MLIWCLHLFLSSLDNQSSATSFFEKEVFYVEKVKKRVNSGNKDHPLLPEDRCVVLAHI